MFELDSAEALSLNILTQQLAFSCPPASSVAHSTIKHRCTAWFVGIYARMQMRHFYRLILKTQWQ